MAEQSKSIPALDAGLEAWLDTEGDDMREVIVEARVPQRRVRLAAGTPQQRHAEEVTTEEGADRTEVLQELQEFLTTVIGRRPRILHAAGAIPLHVTRDQLRQIVGHPLVRAVRTNRRLKPRDA